MSRLTDLIHHAKDIDPQFGQDLETEFRALLKQRSFGLVFERHRPEAVNLPQRRVRKGDTVRILPPRGSLEKGDKQLWRVLSIERNNGSGTANLIEVRKDMPEQKSVTLKDLVVVAAFRDPLYPGLVETGRIERGGDKPFHTIINGENFHVLEMLTYTHRHKIDAIYIDPPYNTGAKDWKYNNDYVEGDDLYRHSKWLAMMERRLNLAKELMNPVNSVLIVTIDEKEYLRLGLLLEQTFPEARITMVTSSVNSGGVVRKGTFARAAEYLYFVQQGASRPTPILLNDEWNAVKTKNKSDLRWRLLNRSGTHAKRTDSPNQFYPIFIRNTLDGPVFEAVGEPFFGKNREEVITPPDCAAIWPIRKDGSDGNWTVSASLLRELINCGHARLGGWRGTGTSIYYLAEGERQKVLKGMFPSVGIRVDGSIITDASEYQRRFVPTDVWRISSHDAGNSGSRLIDRLIPGRKFPFPKSLFAVEDTLRFFVKEKPEAVVLDFFAGSGTTAHAVFRLNKEDSGRRQCISVTNNEVAADEQESLRREGLRPGDPDWEKWGICDYITKPRIQAAISGKTPDGQLIGSDYRFNNESPMSEGFEENAAFFTLTYEGPLSVSHHRAFDKVAPLLWLRAGSVGRIVKSIPNRGWDIAEGYGVLVALDETAAFVKAISGSKTVRIAYIITDDDRRFQMICSLLPDHITPVRLYESYLANFEINSGRCA